MVEPDQLHALQETHTKLHAEIGLVATGWGMLEFQINACIWFLSDVKPVIGACITSQITSMHPRIDCLHSLMMLRGMEEKWIGKLHAFRQYIYSTQEKRNRMVHDPLIYDLISKGAGKIEITARGKPVFRNRRISLEEVKELRKEILKRMDEFADIHAAISSSRDAWPDIPPPESDPMRVTLVLDTQSLRSTSSQRQP